MAIAIIQGGTNFYFALSNIVFSYVFLIYVLFIIDYVFITLNFFLQYFTDAKGYWTINLY